MRLTIDRGIWDRGTGQGTLLRKSEQRKQCCVGILLTSLGVHDESIQGWGCADTVFLRDGLPAEAAFLVDCVGYKSEVAGHLYDFNDREDITEPERERRIAELFAAQGIEVEFVGGEEG